MTVGRIKTVAQMSPIERGGLMRRDECCSLMRRLLRLLPPAKRWHFVELLVDAPVESANQLCHRHLEDLTNAEKGSYSDGSAGFNLLPVPGGEAKTEHIFLRVTALLPQFSYFRAQGAEELVLIRHPLRCKVLRAETPRAD
jgi:hypothetical protein